MKTTNSNKKYNQTTINVLILNHTRLFFWSSIAAVS